MVWYHAVYERCKVVAVWYQLGVIHALPTTWLPTWCTSGAVAVLHLQASTGDLRPTSWQHPPNLARHGHGTVPPTATCSLVTSGSLPAPLHHLLGLHAASKASRVMRRGPTAHVPAFPPRPLCTLLPRPPYRPCMPPRQAPQRAMPGTRRRTPDRWTRRLSRCLPRTRPFTPPARALGGMNPTACPGPRHSGD